MSTMMAWSTAVFLLWSMVNGGLQLLAWGRVDMLLELFPGVFAGTCLAPLLARCLKRGSPLTFVVFFAAGVAVFEWLRRFGHLRHAGVPVALLIAAALPCCVTFVGSFVTFWQGDAPLVDRAENAVLMGAAVIAFFTGPPGETPSSWLPLSCALLCLAGTPPRT